MPVSVTLTVRGTQYHRAEELLQRGALYPGLAIRLEHHPNNPHDKNAVAVLMKNTGEMLGHISRNHAPKYAFLVNNNDIIDATIGNVEMRQGGIHIEIRVVYEQTNEQIGRRSESRLVLSAAAICSEPGVYAIRNVTTGRQYIGSSRDLKDRIRSHLRDLTLGSHANHVLQADFSQIGADYFEVNVLARGILPNDLPKLEAEHIASLLRSGAALYNLTPDGQGVWPPSRGQTDTEPISDRLAAGRFTADQRQIGQGSWGRNVEDELDVGKLEKEFRNSMQLIREQAKCRKCGASYLVVDWLPWRAKGCCSEGCSLGATRDRPSPESIAWKNGFPVK